MADNTGIDCKAELQRLWDIYLKVVSDPNKIQRVRKDGREVEYSGLNLKALERLYMVLWNSCKDKGGLPPIGGQSHIQRGSAHGSRF